MKTLLRWTLLAVAAAAALTSCTDESAMQVRLNGPAKAIVGPDGLLYVADGYINSRIVVYRQDGTFVRSWGSKGYGRGQFQLPHDILFIGDTLVVADRDNGRLQMFSPTGRFLRELFGDSLGRPWALDRLSDGSLVVLDGGDQRASAPRSAIVRIAGDGTVLCRFGSHGSGVGRLDEGHSCAVADDGTVFVVDLQNERLLRYAPTEGCALAPDTSWRPELGGVQPLSVDVRDGLVYVSQQGEGKPIIVLNAATGAVVRTIGQGVFERAHSVEVQPDGSLWVADVYANTVIKISAQGDVLQKIGE